jgi:hypothetical protein
MKQTNIIIALCIMFLAGCTPSANEKVWPVMPEELKDCKFYRLGDGEGNTISVARCPNSSTTVKMNNKQGTTTVVIDGVEYVPNKK